MKIQIVYPPDGWILEKLSRYLIDGISDAHGSPWKPDTSQKWDITYYVNYRLFHTNCGLSGLFQATKNSRVSGGFFTHKEGESFDKRARQLDFCISPCRRYSDYLKTINPKSYCVYHGIDLDRFKPVLRLGFVGKISPNGRKGNELLEFVRTLPYVDLKITGGNLDEDQIPEFYQSVDCVLITSKVEGGPLCFQEGLASGKEIITTDVGMAGEFKEFDGVHVYDGESRQSLINILEEMYHRKLKLRSHIEKYSIDYFVSEH